MARDKHSSAQRTLAGRDKKRTARLYVPRHLYIYKLSRGEACGLKSLVGKQISTRVVQAESLFPMDVHGECLGLELDFLACSTY